MIHLEAFQEFRSGLAFLRGGDAHQSSASFAVRSGSRAFQSLLHFLCGRRGGGGRA